MDKELLMDVPKLMDNYPLKEEGGPVFPITLGNMTVFGMSVRDHFAGEALPKVIERELTVGSYRHFCPASCEQIAQAAYMIADAMLEERKR